MYYLILAIDILAIDISTKLICILILVLVLICILILALVLICILILAKYGLLECTWLELNNDLSAHNRDLIVE